MLNVRLSRKGSSKTATGWLHRVGVYVQEWDTATARVWDSNDAFDMEEFNRYLDSYMSATRLRITQQSHPEEMPGAATWDSYPSQSTVGSRQHAVCSSSNAPIYYIVFHLYMANLVVSLAGTAVSRS
jgi:hypothetical protein